VGRDAIYSGSFYLQVHPEDGGRRFFPNFGTYLNAMGAWIAAGYGLGGRGVGRSSSPGRGKNFLFSTSSRPTLGPTQPPIQWVRGALYPGVKLPGREVHHLPPTSAEVKKTWIYTSTPPYAFMT
jgi:hypothetical protein